MSIEIKDMSFSYRKGASLILDNVTLTIQDGVVSVLLGLNGCGKTTLLKLITGLLKPTKGSVRIDGKDVCSMLVKERSKVIAYVSQKVSCVDDVPVRDYLSFSLANELKFYEVPSEATMQKVAKKADELHISQLLDKNMGEISGGERQLVGICGALLQDSKIIVLDEPTSALDIKNRHLVLMTLKKIAKQENKTIIMSTHEPNHALVMDCNVVLINNGTVSESGYCRNVIRPEVLKTIYGDQICYSNDLNYLEVSYKDLPDCSCWK